MAGFIPAPPPAPTPTRIAVDGGAFQGPGDLTLRSGAGVLLGAEGTDIHFDGLVSDPEQPSALFLPGTVTAGTDVAVFDQGSSHGGAFLRMLELNLGTAPAAATTTDCMALRIRGDGGEEQELKMDSTARRFTFDGLGSTELARAYGANGWPGVKRGVCSPYKMTANMRVAAVQMQEFDDGFGTSSGAAKVIEILNFDRTEVLATTAEFSQALPQRATASGAATSQTSFPLLSALDMEAGVEYWIGCRFTTNTNTTTYELIIGGEAESNIAYSGTVTPITSTSKKSLAIDNNAPSGTNWLATTSDTLLDYGDTQNQQLADPFVASVALFGIPTGADITGDIHIDVLTYGTGGTPGADLNVRMSWYASGWAT